MEGAGGGACIVPVCGLAVRGSPLGSGYYSGAPGQNCGRRRADEPCCRRAVCDGEGRRLEQEVDGGMTGSVSGNRSVPKPRFPDTMASRTPREFI